MLMRTPTDAPAADPTRAVIEALKKSLGDLNAYSVTDLTDDVELAKAIGRLRSLADVLISVVDR